MKAILQYGVLTTERAVPLVDERMLPVFIDVPKPKGNQNPYQIIVDTKQDVLRFRLAHHDDTTAWYKFENEIKGRIWLHSISEIWK